VVSTVTTARYLGTTGRHLAELSRADRWWAMLDPRALFSRRGMLSLFGNRIVLGGWEPHASVTVYAREVESVGISSTVGGVRPIVLRHRNGESLYLMVNHRSLPKRDDNVEWAALLGDWLVGDSFGGSV
jgi:hypothetical protein